jgi:hypothetical protein
MAVVATPKHYAVRSGPEQGRPSFLRRRTRTQPESYVPRAALSFFAVGPHLDDPPRGGGASHLVEALLLAGVPFIKERPEVR